MWVNLNWSWVARRSGVRCSGRNPAREGESASSTLVTPGTAASSLATAPHPVPATTAVISPPSWPAAVTACRVAAARAELSCSARTSVLWLLASSWEVVKLLTARLDRLNILTNTGLWNTQIQVSGIHKYRSLEYTNTGLWNT